MEKFKNKVVLVTGGATGIGRAISAKFYKEGARVVIASRNMETGKLFEEEFPGSVFVATDIRKEENVVSLIKYIEENFGQLDVLVNNASTISNTEGDIQNLSIEEVKEIIETNFYSVFFTTKYATNLLIQSRGTIVNIASGTALEPMPQVPIYSASKSAVLSLTGSTALMLAKHGVRVNSVCPSRIDAPLSYKALGDEEAKKYMSENPLGRPGKPEEVANLVSFLASEESSFITGSNYVIDGGSSRFIVS